MKSWTDISVFLAVMQEGSAAAASRILDMNQTTISRRIERLEADLGLKLFEKGPRGAQPTENARALLHDAQEMAHAADALVSRAESLKRHLSGTIRLTCNSVAARQGIGRILRAFQEEHPEVSFDVDTEDRLLSLEDGEADVAIRTADVLQGDNLIARKLLDHPWAFYASKGYLAERGTPRSFADMTGHDVIRYRDIDEVGCVRLAQSRLPDGKAGLRTNSLAAMVGILSADEGVGFLPRALGDPEQSLEFCFTEPDLTQSLWIATSPEGYATPHIRAFLGFFGRNGKRPLDDIPEEWRA